MTTLAMSLAQSAAGGAQTAVPTPSPTPPPICGGGGNVTLTGHVPSAGGQGTTVLQIADSSSSVNLVVRDDAQRMQQMAPLSRHLGSATEFAAALEAMPMTNANVQTAADLTDSQQRMVETEQSVALAQQALQPVSVDTNGNFTCKGVAPGAYTLVAKVARFTATSTNGERTLWGQRRPNQALLTTNFRVPYSKKIVTVQLKSHFSTIATFGL